MKLRLRSLETKETIRIEVPNPCSLQQLKEILARRLHSCSSSQSSFIHLSLNRKDELHSSSPDESLPSLGITSGDLIFFTFNPYGFASETPMAQSHVHPEPNPNMAQESLILNPNFEIQPYLDSESASFGILKGETPELNTQREEALEIKSEKPEDQDISTDKEQTPDTVGTEVMETDYDGFLLDRGKSFSVPGFLRKVFTAELGDDGGRDHKLLVIAVHAVLLESGFVGFDPVSGIEVSGFHFHGQWPSSGFRMSLSYTLPEIISHGIDNVNRFEAVVLKFQSMGKFFIVRGSLVNGSETHWVQLNEDHLVPFLNAVWANCGSVNEINGNHGFSGVSPETEVFKFWRTVKDKLALPLLIDLCEKVGLPSPSCFMRLPTDLKLKIVEAIPGVDIVKLGCACSELRYLTSNDDLWKQKFIEQFGDGEGSRGQSHWKDRFAKLWENRNKRKTASNAFYAQRRRPPYFFRGPPHPMRNPRFPGILGGDYDLGPAGRAHPQLDRFSPVCYLAGSSARPGISNHHTVFFKF